MSEPKSVTAPDPKVLAAAIMRATDDLRPLLGIDDPEVNKVREQTEAFVAAAKAYGRMLPLVEAIQEWAANCEGQPRDPSDADLLKAIVSFDGDHLEPCEGCDGECGEPCAPYTVEGAHRMYDNFSAEWRKKHGVVVIAAALNPAGPA